MPGPSGQWLLVLLQLLAVLTQWANGQTSCPDIPGFSTYAGEDHVGSDIHSGGPYLNAQDAAAACLLNENCVAVNSDGRIKSDNTVTCSVRVMAINQCHDVNSLAARCYYQRVLKPYRTRPVDTYARVAAMVGLNTTQLESINPGTITLATLPTVLNIPSDSGDPGCDPQWHFATKKCCPPGFTYDPVLQDCACVTGTQYVSEVNMCILPSLLVSYQTPNAPPAAPPSLPPPPLVPPSPPTPLPVIAPSPSTSVPAIAPSPSLSQLPPVPSNQPSTGVVNAAPASHSNTAGIAAGIAVGGALVACLVVLVVIWRCKKRRRDNIGAIGAQFDGKAASALHWQDSTSPTLATITIASNATGPGTNYKQMTSSHDETTHQSARTFSGTLSGATGSDIGNRNVVPAGLDVTAVVQDRMLNSLRIPWSDIELGQQLGQGGFGTVYLGSWKGNKVAVKMLTKEHLSERARAALHNEVLMMCELRHPCIAPAYGLVNDGEHHALVMRYYKRGTLANAMRSLAYERLDQVSRLKIALQVATGISRLHEAQPRPIIHGDLKTTNILLDDDGSWRVVIADFGLACSVSTTGQGGNPVTMGITVSISPPEVLQNPRAPRTLAVDSYAFGIVLLEIMQGAPVYRGMRADDVMNVVKQGRRPPIPDSVPVDIVELIECCWAHDHATRPGFPEITDMLRLCIDKLSIDGTRGHDYLNSTTIDQSDTMSIY